MGNQTTDPSDDNERIIPSKLGSDEATSDSPSEDEDAPNSQCGNDNA